MQESALERENRQVKRRASSSEDDSSEVHVYAYVKVSLILGCIFYLDKNLFSETNFLNIKLYRNAVGGGAIARSKREGAIRAKYKGKGCCRNQKGILV